MLLKLGLRLSIGKHKKQKVMLTIADLACILPLWQPCYLSYWAWPSEIMDSQSSVQGEAQCCVTGPAFECMLQLPDVSVVETIMRNVAVFARMKSLQKGQVMNLLGSRGIHQSFQGQPRHIAVSHATSIR